MNIYRDYICKGFALILSIAFFSHALPVSAMETDQYNLSPIPLTDIGDEFADYVRQHVKLALYELNAKISHQQACLEKTVQGTKCDDAERKKFEELTSPDAVAEAVFKQLGEGNIFTTKTGRWLASHKFAHEPSRYKTSYTDSIFIPMPIDYATLSPTVRVYGVEFGIDKMDHFFQQGYKYYQIYRKAIAKGKNTTEATRRAISWGQRTERTYFGMLVSGVYSNGDLFANYAGMKFYLGLTQRIESRGYPVVNQRDGVRWSLYDLNTPGENLIKPFVSEHLNEALNPSGYSFILYPVVRSVVRKKACPDWRKTFPEMTQDSAAQRTAVLETWNGEDYGFTKSSRQVTIADMCFAPEHKN